MISISNGFKDAAATSSRPVWGFQAARSNGAEKSLCIATLSLLRMSTRTAPSTSVTIIKAFCGKICRNYPFYDNTDRNYNLNHQMARETDKALKFGSFELMIKAANISRPICHWSHSLLWLAVTQVTAAQEIQSEMCSFFVPLPFLPSSLEFMPDSALVTSKGRLTSRTAPGVDCGKETANFNLHCDE